MWERDSWKRASEAKKREQLLYSFIESSAEICYISDGEISFCCFCRVKGRMGENRRARGPQHLEGCEMKARREGGGTQQHTAQVKMQ